MTWFFATRMITVTKHQPHYYRYLDTKLCKALWLIQRVSNVRSMNWNLQGYLTKLRGNVETSKAFTSIITKLINSKHKRVKFTGNSLRIIFPSQFQNSIVEIFDVVQVVVVLNRRGRRDGCFFWLLFMDHERW